MQADADQVLGVQAESVEDVDRRLNGLAKSGRLDPAFMMTMSNAYANTKLTDATREEVRDIMGYMYEQVPSFVDTLLLCQLSLSACLHLCSSLVSRLAVQQACVGHTSLEQAAVSGLSQDMSCRRASDMHRSSQRRSGS